MYIGTLHSRASQFGLLFALLVLQSHCFSQKFFEKDSSSKSDGQFTLSDTEGDDWSEEDWSEVVPASMLQQTPLLEPRIERSGINRNSASSNANLLAPTASSLSQRGNRSSYFGTRDVVVRAEAQPQASADLGDLLKKSSSALSVGVQSKTPVVHDPRIRGARVGSLAASGSHWVPARVDLDTMLSKFDSRQIESTTVVPGPYTSLLGPGFAFTEVQLLQSPRYRNGLEAHGESDLEYRANGNQFFGQQSVMIGSSNWGTRFNYADRSGGDYRDGFNSQIPSSYHSREMTFALGRDWENDSVELNVLRLDQTGVVFPGYVFDLDYLVTDGYEVRHAHEGFGVFTGIETDVWYNRTRFNGNAQNTRKRPFFPVLDQIAYVGFTDVDSMSTGYRQAFVYGGTQADSFKLSVGHDLRFVKQELNEISSSVTLGFPFPVTNRNSPIPQSYIVNPGWFVELEEQITERTAVRLGGRADYAASDITDDPGKLSEVGLDFTPASYAEIVGTSRYDRDFALLSSFLSTTYGLTEAGTASFGIGYAERAPTLTELYAAQPFMLLLQNGLNNVTGDPSLEREKILQTDLGYEHRSEALISGIRGYHAWAFDYITFENTQTLLLPPDANAQQVSLRYVNTELATLAGLEGFSEFFPNEPLTPYANLRFTEGTDRTRNGRFATTNGSAGVASQKDPSQVRGAYSGILGGNTEALPNIPPLEARLGWRLHDTSPRRNWTMDLSTRLVDQQTRVASSLLETATPGFSTWDLRSVFRPRAFDQCVISSGVENFFNRRYREHFDFRTAGGRSVFQPGANFYLSMSLSY